MLNRAIFFAETRRLFFPRGLSRAQVRGLDTLLDVWERVDGEDLRWLAYCLATACHETAFTFQPLRERGLGKGRTYGRPDPETGQVYYGRGFVQLTWKRNYAALGARFNVDLVHRPDLALDPDLSARILFEGMIEGLFTGYRLAHFFTLAETDWEGARRIVNGTDRAAAIAAHAKNFHAALRAASRSGRTSSFASLLRRLRAFLFA